MVASINNAASSYAAQIANSVSCETESKSLTGKSDSSASKPQTVKDIIDLYLKKYSESYDTNLESTDSEDKKKKIKALVSEADKDKDGELSMAELTAVDVSGNKDESNFVQALINQFSSLDKNQDGLLSVDEMQDVKLKKEFSTKEMSDMAQSLSNSNKSNNNSANIASTFEGTLLNYYKKDTADEMTSSINVSA